MVRFRKRIYKDGLIKLPKEVKEHLGEEVEIAPNYFAAVMYPKDADLRRVLKSLEIIAADLKNQLEAMEDRDLHRK